MGAPREADSAKTTFSGLLHLNTELQAINTSRKFVDERRCMVNAMLSAELSFQPNTVHAYMYKNVVTNKLPSLNKSWPPAHLLLLR